MIRVISEMNATEYIIMDTIRKVGLPVGAGYLSGELKIPPASIGRVLISLEKEGLLEKVSNKGRRLTDRGHRYMAEQEQLNAQKETLDIIIYMMNDTQKDRLMDILQARILLECYTVEMACKNATEENLHSLNALMLEYIYEVRQHGIASEQNLQMHLAIAELGGNQTVLQLLKLILVNDDLQRVFLYCPKVAREPACDARQHHRGH